MITAGDSLEFGQWERPEAVVFETARGAQPDPLAVDQSLSAPVLDTLSVVKRRAPTTREKMSSGAVYTGAELVFIVPAAAAPPRFAPKPGDVVVDAAGLRWTVQRVAQNHLRTTWRLETLDLALALDLRDLVTVQRPGIVADASGATLRVWPPDGRASTPYADLPARVNLTGEQTRDERGIRGMVRRYDVIVGLQASVRKDDRVRWGNYYLDVVGYRQAQRVDELPVIECELVP